MKFIIHGDTLFITYSFSQHSAFTDFIWDYFETKLINFSLVSRICWDFVVFKFRATFAWIFYRLCYIYVYNFFFFFFFNPFLKIVISQFIFSLLDTKYLTYHNKPLNILSNAQYSLKEEDVKKFKEENEIYERIVSNDSDLLSLDAYTPLKL